MAQITDSPEEFFNNITLNSADAKRWLVSRISASETLDHLEGKGSPPRPQIWMLTGLIFMAHATWTNLSSDEQSFKVGHRASFDPIGVTTIRRLSVSECVRPTFGFQASDDVKNVSGAIIHETGKYPGMRVWAAQWQRIDVQIESTEKWKNGVKNQLRLKHKSGTPSNIAVVELHADDYAKSRSLENKAEGYVDDKYWEAFLDISEEYT